MMKTLTCIGRLSIAIALSSHAIAAEPTWVPIHIKPSEMQSAYDSSSLVIDGTQRTAWVEIRYVPPTRMGVAGLVSRMVSLMTYDCFRRTAQSAVTVIYAPNGQKKEESNPNERAERVKSGTVGESQLDAVCAVAAGK